MNIAKQIVNETYAIEEILTKAPTRDAEFHQLIEDIYLLLGKTFEKETKAIYQVLLKQLYDGELTADKADKIVSEALGINLSEKLAEPMYEWAVKVHHLGTEEIAAQAGIDISYNLADRRAINILNKQNLFWIGEYYNEQSRDIMQNEFNRMFAEGITRNEIAELLATTLDDGNRRALNYFRGFTEHAASRVRSVGQITGYEKANIEYAQVVATLDDRTTEICREMNGRLIPVRIMSEVKNDLVSIETEGRSVDEVKDDLKRIVPFWNDKNTKDQISGRDTKNILQHHRELSMPPYHWRCRTKTVAYFEEE